MLADLSRSPIAETLRRLSAERRSGDLQVQSSAGVKTAFFDHGRLVFAASSLRDDRLGESLVDAGRITEQQFAQATALMQQRRQRFGEALVAAGVMDKQELGRSVARQVRRIVLSLFPLSEGIASFEERACAIPLEYMVNLSLHHVLYSGIRRMTEEPLVRRGIGPLERRVDIADVPPFRLTVDQCSVEERELLGRCRSRPSLLRLVDGEDGVSFARLRAAYALLASGVLRDPTQSDQPQPVLQPDEDGFLLSALQRRPELAEPDTRRREIAAELARSAGDREGWLSVSRSAPVEDVIPALRKKIERYHDLLDAVEDDVALRTDVELILGRAYALVRRLRNAAQGTAAAASAKAAAAAQTTPPKPTARREPAPEKPARVAATARPGSETLPPAPLPVPAPTAVVGRPAAAEVPAAGSATLPPAPLPAATVKPQPAAAHKPAAAAPVLPASPSMPTAAPEATSRADAATADTSGALQAEAPAPAPGPAATLAPVPAAASNSQIDHLLTWGNIQMTISDYASAVNTFSELVDLAPKVPAYHLRLAVAMALWPQTAKRAERAFHEALRLDPDSVDVRYQLAIYYKTMKLRARALEQLRIALTLNPQHKRAREELEILSPKDSALGSLKKLFR